MILVTNDDGYSSKYLKQLYNILCKMDDDVKMVVSNKEQSACGNKSSPSKKFDVKKINEGYLINGTPVDCIRFGVNKFNPKLIVTGINNGFNLGWDSLLSSGTFMSAREGAKNNNIKSLSCSINKNSYINDDDLYYLLKKVLNENFLLGNLNIVNKKYMFSIPSKDILYNIMWNGDKMQLVYKKKYLKQSDANVVFNQKKSSLSIIKR